MRVWLIAGALLLLSCSHAQPGRVQNGVIDLRAVDLAREEPISLDGSWEFYPGVFLQGDGHDTPTGDLAYLNVPGSWNAFVLPGKTSMGALGFGSYRLRILLQSRRPLHHGSRRP